MLVNLRSPLFCSTHALHFAGDNASPLRIYGVSKSMELCEADIEVCRLKEELPLLLREMQSHTRYWQRLLQRQQRLETVLLATTAGGDVLPQQLQGQLLGCGYIVSSTQHGRYHPGAEQLLTSPDTVSGAVGLVRLGQLEAKQQLAKAVALFGPFVAHFTAAPAGEQAGEDAFVDGGLDGSLASDADADDVAEDSEDSEAWAPGGEGSSL